MSKTGFDISPMLKRLDEYDRRVTAAAKNALTRFAEHVKGQAQEYSPVETSNLQRSASATDAEGRGDIIEARVGFNTPYAAAVHEKENQIINTARNPKARRKYLETAMREEAPKMAGFVADVVKEEVG